MIHWKDLNKTYLYIFGSVFLAAFLKFWEPGLGFSSATYGALAKSFLSGQNLFHPRLGPGIFDPFVEHPYLVLWLDALVFKIFGISAQTVRLIATFSGLLVFTSVFFSMRKLYDELTAVVCCFGLFILNDFMNFMSSGWLDMPMVALSLLGFWLIVENLFFLGGLALSCAVLAKGVGALGVLPIGLWAIYINPKKSLNFILGSLLPLGIFTLAHYQAEGFLFWKEYLHRQLVEQNDLEKNKNVFWYPLAILRFGHVVAVTGLYQAFKLAKHKNSLGYLILAQVLFHSLIYGFSERHHGQYVLPVLPWLAMGFGILVRPLIRITAKVFAQRLFRFALSAFVIVEILPIKVHSGISHPFRAFQHSLEFLHDNKKVYFFGDLKQQWTWEDLASDIPWYWDRTPLIANSLEIIENLQSKDKEAIGLWPMEEFKKLTLPQELKLCFWNETYALVTQKNLCPDDQLNYRPSFLEKQRFTR